MESNIELKRNSMKEASDKPVENSPEVDSKNDAVISQPKNKKKITIFISIAVLIISSIGGFFWYKSKENSVEPTPVAQKEVNENIFYKLDDIIVNLNTSDAQSRFLKIGITLQLNNKETVVKLDNSLPIIKDLIQSYLRELRPQDLNGSAGLYRIKDELLLRLNEIMLPNKIVDVLFRDILVQ
ncbi:Flagellar FliL protein [Rickettsiales bacterium Ac37b]|nr:Flagellar FliL protein [Rickettsiales bacterium Ac37b]